MSRKALPEYEKMSGSQMPHTRVIFDAAPANILSH